MLRPWLRRYLDTSVGATTLGVATAFPTHPGVGVLLPGATSRPAAPTAGSLPTHVAPVGAFALAAIPFAGQLDTPANSLGRLAATALMARAVRRVPSPLGAGVWGAT
jgi:hypothetical protein